MILTMHIYTILQIIERVEDPKEDYLKINPSNNIYVILINIIFTQFHNLMNYMYIDIGRSDNTKIKL